MILLEGCIFKMPDKNNFQQFISNIVIEKLIQIDIYFMSSHLHTQIMQIMHIWRAVQGEGSEVRIQPKPRELPHISKLG